MIEQQRQGCAPATSPLKSILWFASSNVFRQALGAVATLLRPILLSPELFGLFSTLRLLPTYGTYLHLGARHAMRYLTPQYEAHGEHDRANELRATVLAGSFALNAIFALVLLGLAALTDWQIEVRIGLAICAAIVLLDALFEHYVAEMKAFQRFRDVGVTNYLTAIVSLVVSAALIFSLGFYGAMLAEGVVTGIMLLYLARRGLLKVQRGFDRRVFAGAIAFGSPTLLFEGTLLMMRTTDRVVIAAGLGYEQVGLYALGAMMMGYVMHIPGATREVMEARLFQHRLTMPAADAVTAFVLRPMKMVALTMPAVIGPMVLLLPPFIGWLMPEYREGIRATQVLMLGGYFLAVSFPIRGVLVAYGWQTWGASVLLGAVTLHAGISLALVQAGFGIVGVAVSAGLSFLAAGVGLFCLVVLKLPTRPPELFASAVHMLLPFPLMLGFLRLATEFGTWLGWSLWPTLLVELCLYGLLLAIYALVALRAGVAPALSKVAQWART